MSYHGRGGAQLTCGGDFRLPVKEDDMADHFAFTFFTGLSSLAHSADEKSCRTPFLSMPSGNGMKTSGAGKAHRRKSIIAILLANLLLLHTVVFSVLGLALKNILDLNSFVTAFWFFLTLGEGLGGFDLVIIDLVSPSVSASPSCRNNPPIKTLQHVSSFLRLFPLLSSLASCSC